MKPLIFTLLLISFFSCKEEKTESNTLPKTEISTIKAEEFTWLLGDWIRLNETDGKQTYESWTKEPGNSYSGIGYTMLNNDTIWKEDLSINKMGNDWVLQVLDPKAKDSVLFKITDIKTNEFTAENKANDFPKKITYWKENKQLKAKVANNEFNIEFEFQKTGN